MTKYDLIFKRTFELARRGGRNVGTNPQVGAVILVDGKIIGEGWHEKSGEAHAEINALRNVQKDNLPLLKHAKIFVSLEPCSHYGKTPPCALAIVEAGIPEVHIAILDPTDKVSGKGIEILENAGIKVYMHNLCEAESVIDSFLIGHKYSRPKVLLKYAQSSDKFISKVDEQTWLSNAFSKRLVHAYREKVGAILIGRKTAEIDNPSLTTRFGFGDNPVKIILDLNGKLLANLRLFSERNKATNKTYLLTSVDHPLSTGKLPQLEFVRIDSNLDFFQQLFSFLRSISINTLLVEGGAQTLNSFIAANHWDEALVFQSKTVLSAGVPAPDLPEQEAIESISIKQDDVFLYRNMNR